MAVEPNDLNSQLKAVHARLDRIDDDLIAHYAGISRIVIGMSKNKYVWKIGLRNLTTYNMSSLGQKAVRKLLHLIPGYDAFKRLQNLDAAALIGNIEEAINNQIANIENTLTDAINSAADALTSAQGLLTSAQGTLTSAQNALTTALGDGSSAEVIAEKQAAVTASASSVTKAATAVTNATADSEHITKALGSKDSFMSVLDNIAKGKTKNAIFTFE